MSAETDNKFKKAFNRLDNMLRDMYPNEENQSSGGVTRYINHMRELGLYSVVAYEDDYKRLKDLRDKRNIFIHEDIENLFKASDIEYIDEFYGRVINGTDPIGLHNESIRRKRRTEDNSTDKSRKNKKKISRTILWCLLIIDIAILCILLCTI